MVSWCQDYCQEHQWFKWNDFRDSGVVSAFCTLQIIPECFAFWILTASFPSFPASSLIFRVSVSSSVIQVPARKSANILLLICFYYGNKTTLLELCVHLAQSGPTIGQRGLWKNKRWKFLVLGFCDTLFWLLSALFAPCSCLPRFLLVCFWKSK